MMRRRLMIGAVVLVGLILAGYLYSQDYVRRIEAKYPPTGGFVAVEGARLHYVERLPDPLSTTPSGRTVVLIHGASVNLNDQINALANPLAIRGYRVIAFDRPGLGHSERGPKDAWKPEVQARMIREALQKLSIEDPVIVGHSWGGAVAAAFLLNESDYISGAVIISGATYPWPGGATWYNNLVLTPVIGPLFLYCAVPAYGQLRMPSAIAENFAPDTPPEDYANRTQIPLLFRPKTFIYNAEDNVHLKAELEKMSKRYDTITKPLTIIHGTDDRTVSAAIHSVALHEAVPGSKLVLLEGTGHMPHYARTSEVVAEIDMLARKPGE